MRDPAGHFFTVSRADVIFPSYLLVSLSVGELAERYVKQLSHGLDWETPGLVQQLLGLYLGTTATPGKRPHPQVAVESFIDTV